MRRHVDRPGLATPGAVQTGKQDDGRVIDVWVVGLSQSEPQGLHGVVRLATIHTIYAVEGVDVELRPQIGRRNRRDAGDLGAGCRRTEKAKERQAGNGQGGHAEDASGVVTSRASNEDRSFLVHGVSFEKVRIGCPNSRAFDVVNARRVCTNAAIETDKI